MLPDRARASTLQCSLKSLIKVNKKIRAVAAAERGQQGPFHIRRPQQLRIFASSAAAAGLQVTFLPQFLIFEIVSNAKENAQMPLATERISLLF